jgi:hypothetical protein
MFNMSVTDFVMTMSIALFIMGAISMGLGMYTLVSRVLGEDVRVIAKQTARMAQKGISEEVAGLVGTASNLLDSLNSLVQTTSGVGMFLMLAGFALILCGYFLTRQVF